MPIQPPNRSVTPIVGNLGTSESANEANAPANPDAFVQTTTSPGAQSAERARLPSPTRGSQRSQQRSPSRTPPRNSGAWFNRPIAHLLEDNHPLSSLWSQLRPVVRDSLEQRGVDWNTFDMGYHRPARATLPADEKPLVMVYVSEVPEPADKEAFESGIEADVKSAMAELGHTDIDFGVKLIKGGITLF